MWRGAMPDLDKWRYCLVALGWAGVGVSMLRVLKREQTKDYAARFLVRAVAIQSERCDWRICRDVERSQRVGDVGRWG